MKNNFGLFLGRTVLQVGLTVSMPFLLAFAHFLRLIGMAVERWAPTPSKKGCDA